MPSRLHHRARPAFAPAGLAALTLTLAAASPVAAQDGSGPAVAFNAAATSDYVFRGVSQTQEDPAISAGVDIGDAFYAGAWVSTVDFGDDTEAEVDLYAGARRELGGWALDVGAVGYFYVEQPGGADYDFVELKVAASRAMGPATVGFAAYWSPDFFGATEDESTYLEVNTAFSPADRWTVSGAAGRQMVSSALDYTTWNLGAAYQLTDHLAVDARYHDTDQHGFGAAYESRAVVSLKAAF